MKTRDRRKALEQALASETRSSRTYVGTVADMDWAVTVSGRPLPPRRDLQNHSPDGFAWGYTGSGPSQLALAILADCMGDEFALQHYQDFKFEVIASLAQDTGFVMPVSDVKRWAAAR